MWSNGYAPPFEDAFNYPLATGFGAERFKWLNEAIVCLNAEKTC
ncbi:Undefined function [Listeria monocytogenes]|nr:Undefined function [Listeria monocytogenes]